MNVRWQMRFRQGRIDEQVTRFRIETTASDGEFWLVNYLLILTSDWSTLTSDWSIIVSTHFWFVTSGVGIEVWRSRGSMRWSSWGTVWGAVGQGWIVWHEEWRQWGYDCHPVQCAVFLAKVLWRAMYPALPPRRASTLTVQWPFHHNQAAVS